MTHRITPENITRLLSSEFFVYGSNIAGRHGAGAALTAYKKFGATLGRCHGFDNQTYGIPTKDEKLNVLPLQRIEKYIGNLIDDAIVYSERIFLVTAVGCGRAGYTPEEIAPLFKRAIDVENIYLPESFWRVLIKSQ